MHVLICYATTEGQTRKIAMSAAETLMRLGHKTTVKPAPIADAADLQGSDAVILAGSLHMGRYQSELVDCIRKWSAQLKDKPSAFVSVSLSAAGDDDDMHDAERCAAKLADKTGWTPDRVHHAAGAFRFSRYSMLKRLAMRFVAMNKDRTVDPRVDREYTDWAALERFVAEFAEFASDRKAA